jgi:hypothetical protein
MCAVYDVLNAAIEAGIVKIPEPSAARPISVSPGKPPDPRYASGWYPDGVGRVQNGDVACVLSPLSRP